MFTRRDMLRTSAAAVAAPLLLTTVRAEEPAPVGFTLPKLPYAYDALEPSIDKETMEIHHGKHHNAYVTNLNAALKKDAPELLKKPIEAICYEQGQAQE